MATVNEIKDQVGDDPAKAQEYLDIEQASASPRTTLVDYLQAIVDQAAAAADGQGSQSGTIEVIARASVLGLTVDEIGIVPDDLETQACLERGLIEKVG